MIWAIWDRIYFVYTGTREKKKLHFKKKKKKQIWKYENMKRYIKYNINCAQKFYLALPTLSRTRSWRADSPLVFFFLFANNVQITAQWSRRNKMKTYEQISGIIHTDTQYTSNATAATAAFCVWLHYKNATWVVSCIQIQCRVKFYY